MHLLVLYSSEDAIVVLADPAPAAARGVQTRRRQRSLKLHASRFVRFFDIDCFYLQHMKLKINNE